MGLYDNLRVIAPYVPGEQPQNKNVVKLNTNENPYPPSSKVLEVKEAYNTDNLKLYPDPDITKLSDELALYFSDKYGINLERENIFVGVGSDDVLAVAFQTFFNSGRPILFPDVTYSFYDVWADLYKIDYETIPLKDDFIINPDDYNRECGGIVIANPNAPTTIELGTEAIEKILKDNSEVVVIVDEAYIDFGGNSMISLLEKYENLVVVQTYSKSRSMAGARIGYALGGKKLIKAMEDVKFSINSYTLSNLQILMGVASLKDEEYFKESINKIINTRENAKKRFKELGFSLPDSKTNFLFVTHEKLMAKDIFEYLKGENIFVRYFKKPERISNYLRVTIGTDEQMDALFAALEKLIKNSQ